MNMSVATIETNLAKNKKLDKSQIIEVLPSLEKFLKKWDNEYQEKISHIPLFNIEKLDWSDDHKQFFCKLLYHARGRLRDFLWHLGNIAPDKKSKDLVLYNFSEEFGGHSPSHEELYFYFTKDLGIFASQEVMDQQYYLPFFKRYNEELLTWLRNHDWDDCISAFSAYERLDNADYSNLYEVAKKLGASNKGLIFFKIHAKAEHFTATVEVLNHVWKRNEEIVKKAFAFIGEHQAKMWKNLSDATLNYLD